MTFSYFSLRFIIPFVIGCIYYEVDKTLFKVNLENIICNLVGYGVVIFDYKENNFYITTVFYGLNLNFDGHLLNV